MKTIMFNFRSEVPPKDQNALLTKINNWVGISGAGHIKPDSKNPAILKMCYIYVSDDTETEVMIEKLSALSEVESASIPAERRLL